MKVRFKKLVENAVEPRKAHPSDAGFDLTAVSRVESGAGCYVYGTGIAVEIPEGYMGLVFPRSSIAKTDLFLTNAVGVVDSHYRGEIMAKFKSNRDFPFDKYEVGDRIAQLVILPYPEIEFEAAESLSESDRGEEGFGSTGR